MSYGLRRATLRLLRDRRGLSTVEYAIVLVLVAALCIGLFQAFGKKLRCSMSAASSEFGRVTGEGPGAAGPCPEPASAGSNGPSAPSGPSGPATPNGPSGPASPAGGGVTPPKQKRVVTGG